MGASGTARGDLQGQGSLACYHPKVSVFTSLITINGAMVSLLQGLHGFSSALPRANQHPIGIVLPGWKAKPRMVSVAGCVPMGSTEGSSEEPLKLILGAATISAKAGARLQELLAAGQAVNISPWAPTYSRYDASEIVMWLIAVAAVTAAGLWAGSDFLEERLSRQSFQVDPHSMHMCRALFFPPPLGAHDIQA